MERSGWLPIREVGAEAPYPGMSGVPGLKAGARNTTCMSAWVQLISCRNLQGTVDDPKEKPGL